MPPNKKRKKKEEKDFFDQAVEMSVGWLD